MSGSARWPKTIGPRLVGALSWEVFLGTPTWNTSYYYCPMQHLLSKGRTP